MNKNTVSYQKIFNDIHFEEGDSSRSVLSPAAYLADLLFLKEDIGEDDALVGRREDISTIPLNKDNTQSLLPHLEIANEVMKGYVGTIDKSDPAYKVKLNTEIDGKCVTSLYPFNAPYSLPFNKEYDKSVAALNYVKTSTHEFYQQLTDLPKGEISAREILGISIEEYNAIITSPQTDDAIKNLWGLDSFTNLSLSDLKNLDTFLELAMISEKELREILYQNCNSDELKEDDPKYPKSPVPATSYNYNGFFINNGGFGTLASIDERVPEESIGTVEENGDLFDLYNETGRVSGYKQPGEWLRIEDIPRGEEIHKELIIGWGKAVPAGNESRLFTSPTFDYYERINRFIRLKNVLGWSYATLDRVLMTVCQGILDEETIKYVAIIKDINDRLGMDIETICSLIAGFKNFGFGDVKNVPADQFNIIFNNGYDVLVTKDSVTDDKNRIMSACGISEEEFGLISSKIAELSKIVELSKIPEVPSPLNIELVAYRVKSMADMLNISVADVFTFCEIIEVESKRNAFAPGCNFKLPVDLGIELQGTAISFITALFCSKKELGVEVGPVQSLSEGVKENLTYLQICFKLSEWMQKYNITVSQLSYMINGKQDTYVKGSVPERALITFQSQLAEMINQTLITADSLVLDKIEKSLAEKLLHEFASRQVVNSEGIFTAKSEESLTVIVKAALDNILGKDSSDKNDDYKASIRTIAEKLTSMGEAQETVVCTMLQNLFGMSEQVIRTLCGALLSENFATDSDFVVALAAPALESLSKPEILHPVLGENIAVIQHYAFIINKLELSDDEVFTLADTYVFRDRKIDLEDKANHFSGDIEEYKSEYQIPGGVNSVFTAPNGNIVAIQGDGYFVRDEVAGSVWSPKKAINSEGEWKDDTGLQLVPHALGSISAAFVANSGVYLFSGNKVAFVVAGTGNGTISDVSEVFGIKNNIQENGTVDCAFVKSGVLYITSGNQIFRYSSLKNTLVDEGFPKTLNEHFGVTFEAPHSDKLDAVLTIDGVDHYFSGNKYVTIKTEIDPGTEKSIDVLSLSEDISELLVQVENPLLEGKPVTAACMKDNKLYLFSTFRNNETCVYRYSSVAAAVSDAACDLGYPKLLKDETGLNNKPDAANPTDESEKLRANSIPSRFTPQSALVVSKDADEETYLFNGKNYIASSDFADVRDVSDLWISEASEGGFTSIDAAVMDEQERTFLFSGNQYIYYTGSDYSVMATDSALPISNWGGITPAASKITAAFLYPMNPSAGVEEQNKRLFLIFDNKFAIYSISENDTPVMERAPEDLTKIEELSGGFPSFKDANGNALNVQAVYAEGTTLYIYHNVGSDLKLRTAEAGNAPVDKDPDTNMDGVSAIFRGVDNTKYFFKSNSFYIADSDAAITSLPLTAFTISKFFGKKGVAQNFTNIESAFNVGSDYYFIDGSGVNARYIKTTYNNTASLLDGFIVAEGYPKSIAELANDIAITAPLYNSGDVVINETDKLVFSDNTVSVNGVVEPISTHFATLPTPLKTESIKAAFASTSHEGVERSYLILENSYYRFSGSTLAVDRGYPKAYNEESWKSEELGEFTLTTDFASVFYNHISKRCEYIVDGEIKARWGLTDTPLDRGEEVDAVVSIDPNTHYMFCGDSYMKLEELRITSPKKRNAFWEEPSLPAFSSVENIPASIKDGFDAHIVIDSDHFFYADHLFYCATNATKSKIDLTGKTAFTVNTIVYHDDIMITPSGMQSITAIVDGFPYDRGLSNVLSDTDNGDTYYVFGSDYVKVNGITFREGSTYRLLADETPLSEIEKYTMLKEISSFYNKTDASILDYFNRKSSKSLEDITGWSGVGNIVSIPALYTEMKKRHYLDRFPVSDTELEGNVLDKIWGASSNLAEASANLFNYVLADVNKKDRELFFDGYKQKMLVMERDALVGLSLVQRTNELIAAGEPFKLATPRDLYGHLLTDVLMSEESQTSRIKEGTLAIQLYFHRFLMGLEEKAHDGRVYSDPKTFVPVPAGKEGQGTHNWSDFVDVGAGNGTHSKSSDGTFIEDPTGDYAWDGQYLVAATGVGTHMPRHEGAFEGDLKQWWEWMKNYRVWEANRKVFMYPENYIRPELRDSKSPLFKELEETILESDITDASVQDAYLKYLDGFNEVSRLKVVGGYVYNEKGTKDLVMFGRTRTEPSEYYYATGEAVDQKPERDGDKFLTLPYRFNWNAWQKMNIQIHAPLVKPVFAFNRMFVFWLEYKRGEMEIGFKDGLPSGDDKVIYEPVIKYSFYDLSKKWSLPQEFLNFYEICKSRGTNLRKLQQWFGTPNGFSLLVKSYDNTLDPSSEDGEKLFENIYVGIVHENDSYNSDFPAGTTGWNMNDSLERRVETEELYKGIALQEAIFPEASFGINNSEITANWSVYNAHTKRVSPWYSFHTNGGSTLCVPCENDETANDFENITPWENIWGSLDVSVTGIKLDASFHMNSNRVGLLTHTHINNSGVVSIKDEYMVYEGVSGLQPGTIPLRKVINVEATTKAVFDMVDNDEIIVDLAFPPVANPTAGRGKAINLLKHALKNPNDDILDGISHNGGDTTQWRLGHGAPYTPRLLTNNNVLDTHRITTSALIDGKVWLITDNDYHLFYKENEFSVVTYLTKNGDVAWYDHKSNRYFTNIGGNRNYLAVKELVRDVENKPIPQILYNKDLEVNYTLSDFVSYDLNNNVFKDKDDLPVAESEIAKDSLDLPVSTYSILSPFNKYPEKEQSQLDRLKMALDERYRFTDSSSFVKKYFPGEIENVITCANPEIITKTSNKEKRLAKFLLISKTGEYTEASQWTLYGQLPIICRNHIYSVTKAPKVSNEGSHLGGLCSTIFFDTSGNLIVAGEAKYVRYNMEFGRWEIPLTRTVKDGWSKEEFGKLPKTLFYPDPDPSHDPEFDTPFEMVTWAFPDDAGKSEKTTYSDDNVWTFPRPRLENGKFGQSPNELEDFGWDYFMRIGTLGKKDQDIPQSDDIKYWYEHDAFWDKIDTVFTTRDGHMHLFMESGQSIVSYYEKEDIVNTEYTRDKLIVLQRELTQDAMWGLYPLKKSSSEYVEDKTSLPLMKLNPYYGKQKTTFKNFLTLNCINRDPRIDASVMIPASNNNPQMLLIFSGYKMRIYKYANNSVKPLFDFEEMLFPTPGTGDGYAHIGDVFEGISKVTAAVWGKFEDVNENRLYLFTENPTNGIQSYRSYNINCDFNNGKHSFETTPTDTAGLRYVASTWKNLPKSEVAAQGIDTILPIGYSNGSCTRLAVFAGTENGNNIDLTKSSLYFYDTSKTEADTLPNISMLGRYGLLRLTSNTADKLIQKVFANGPSGLLTREIQEGTYLDNDSNVKEFPSYSKDGGNSTNKIAYDNELIDNDPTSRNGDEYGLDFDGATSTYYWEIFFHIPYLIANRLNEQQRFSDAKKWFEYVYNPLEANMYTQETKPEKNYWLFKPFFDDTTTDNKFLAQESSQLKDYYDDPFDPHAIAQNRQVAYRKALVMAYVDNVLDWGDNLFRQYSMESINEARMLYMLAYDLLGGKPVSTGMRENGEDRNFENLIVGEGGKTGLRSTAIGAPLRLLGLENAPGNGVGYNGAVDATITNLSTPNDTMVLGDYFHMPENEQFIKYWDRVEDRIAKIRNGENIDGVKVPLPLFQAPIDPMAIVSALGSGGSLSQVLGSLNATIPHYRFRFMVSKAKELAGRVNQLGGAMLSALEKKDAETISILRNTHEKEILELTLDIREEQKKDRENTKEQLGINLKSAQFRRDHYIDLISNGLSSREKTQLTSLVVAQGFREKANLFGLTSSIMSYVPQVGSPFAMVYGGRQLHGAFQGLQTAFNNIASKADLAGTLASITGGYKRREQDWKFQRDLAIKEIEQIDKQIAGADIQIEVAKMEINQVKKQMKHNESVNTFMTSKFTNKELYQWMSSKLSGLFYQSYQLALDLAKEAQQSFRFEMGLKESEVNYLTSYYWDSQKKGLLAGEILMNDLDRMEKGYMDKNSRRFEVSKSVSLLELDPEAVLRLKKEGECSFTLPESLFALDFPSHYCRQIKSVSITIPAVVGPYQNVNATLTQQSHYSLLEADADSFDFFMDPENGEMTEHIRADWRGQQQIAISRGVNDSGMFQLNFQDERYLPYEGTGTHSTWGLKLNGHNGSFDVSTLSDVIVKVEYTALQGGESFGKEIEDKLTGKKARTTKLFNISQHFASDWNRYLQTPEEGLKLQLTRNMFPGIEDSNLENAYVVFEKENLKEGGSIPVNKSVEISGTEIVLNGIPENVKNVSVAFDYDMTYRF